METLIIHTDDLGKSKAVKAFLKALNIDFEAKKDSPYDPEFVKKIQESEQDKKAGKVTIIETSDLWNPLARI